MESKQILLAITAIAILLALGWLFTGNDFFLYKVFAPKYEQVRRETFEQSKAYVQGNLQELRAMQLQYVQASPEHQAALRAVILHRTADFPADKLPADLATFIQTLKNQSLENQPSKY
jgi:hypothetical protein